MWIHWTALGAAVGSLLVLFWWTWGDPGPALATALQTLDIGLAFFFAVELFTRNGFQRSGLAYLRWRWFDYIAMLPIVALGSLAFTILLWPVLVCRVIRLVDRTLGDGFVRSKLLLLMSIAEEELSDRLLDKMLTRWEAELKNANFGTAMSKALSRNKDAVLLRVYNEQLQDGTFAKIAHYTGLQATLEKEERRLFGAVIEMVGSHEVDDALRDVIGSALERARHQLGDRDWKRQVREAFWMNVPDAPRKLPRRIAVQVL